MKAIAVRLAFALPTLIAALIMWRFLPDTNSRKLRDTRHSSLFVFESKTNYLLV
jgi:hypothetical protein